MLLCIGNVGVLRAGFKGLMILDPSAFVSSVLQDFWGNPRIFGDSGCTKQSATDEPKVIKVNGDTELSIAILERHLAFNK